MPPSVSDAATQKILVVEDNPKTAENLALYLNDAGYETTVAGDGRRGLGEARTGAFDLVILDLMLPGLDGLELCRRLRRESRVPVLMLTARALEDDRVRGLGLGADDYVTKPFSPREVVARVAALLRRAAWHDGSPGGDGRLRFGELTVDPERHVVHVGGRPAALTATEFKLLEALIRSPGRVFTRAALIDHALGHDFEGMDRTVDAHIMKLRRKIEPDRRRPTYIHTVFGVGYKLGADDA